MAISGRFQTGQSGNPNGRPKKYNTTSIADARRDYKLRAKYGISIQEYNELFEKQGGRCAICGQKETKTQSRGKGLIPTIDSLQVDHDHETGKIRGLLCYRCNTGIGKLFDNPRLLRKAADYLDSK